MKHFYAALSRHLKFTGNLRFMLTILLSFAVKIAICQGDIFVDVTGPQFPGLPQLVNSTSGWADYDGDGRPDLLISGMSTTNAPVTKLYHNTAKGFVDVSNLVPGLPQVYLGSVAWGDYNNDGKPDFFICGDNGSTRISKLYQNTGNGFTDKSGVVKGLLGFSFSSAAWGNWTNDGFPSLIVIGYTYDSTIYGSRPTTRLYISNGDSLFENTYALPNVPQLANGCVDWADYDHDGFIDLTVSGFADGGSQTHVYHNNKGIYWEDRSYVIPNLPSLMNSSLAWIDFNKNGLSGLIVTGNDASNNPVTQVYTNLSNHSFNKQSPGIVAVDSGSVAWGDYDRDGRPDLLISGSANGTPTTKLYHNTKNGFTDVTNLLPGIVGLVGSAAAWGDYDKDGWLDIMIMGDMLKTVSGGHYFGALYHNKSGNGFENKSVDLSIAGANYSLGYGSVSWMPVDVLGYPDLVLNGDAEGLIPYLAGPYMVYLENTFFNPIKGFEIASQEWNGIPALKNNSMDWADFNKDGLIDLMIIGRGKANNSSTSQLKQMNSNGVNFKDVTSLLPGLPNLNRGSVKWGDYDNDGWPDLAVCGLDDAGTAHTLIYHNEKGAGFTNVSSLFPNLPPVYDGSVAWGDFDNDGRADLLLTGITPLNNKGPVTTMLYHSETNGFTDRSDLLPGLPQVGYSTASFADVNNDGLVDILVTGRDNTLHTTLALYYNSTTSITLKKDTTLLKGVPGFTNASITWGDYDNDGKTDLFLTGRSVNKTTSALYHNTGNGFEDKSGILPMAAWYNPFTMGVYGGSASFVDYDLDGRQDLFLTGENSNGTVYSSLWRSANTNANNLLPGLQGIANGSASWGDYDNDGKPDLFVTGVLPDGHTCFTKLYHNLGGIFEDKSNLLPGLQPFYRSAVAWGDYDNDGRIDLFVMGSQGSGIPFIKLYHNTDSSFNDVSGLLPSLLQLHSGDAAWADYDNDGRPDLIITGVDVNNKTATLLYHNKGNGFEDAGSWFSGLPYSSTGFGSVAWVDYNNDGKPDLFITGINPLTGDAVANLYYNTGSGFATDPQWHWNNIPGLSETAVAWGDYNNDGWTDLFLSGETSTGNHVSKLMQNNHGYFTDVSSYLPGLPALSKSSAAWGDFDNDGLRDLVLTGEDASGKPAIKLYRQRGSGLFADVTSPFGASLQGMLYSSVAVADYDNDGNLDFVITGNTGAGYSSVLYHNPLSTVSSVPTAPAGLSSAVSTDGTSVTLTWKAQTPPQGLNYNIYVGTTSGGQDVLSPMADLSNGYRRVVQTGNSQTNTYTLKNLTPGKAYYWSVQAIDAAYRGSNFTAEQQFTTGILEDEATILDTITAASQGVGIRIDWNTLQEEPGDWFVAEKKYLNGPFVPVSGKIYVKGSPSSYSAYDRLALQGENSYRVKIFDKEGNFTISDTVTVNIGSNDTCSLIVYPNPVHDVLNVELGCSGKTKLGGVVSVINQNGNIVMVKYMQGIEAKLDVSRLIPGIYYVQYNDGFRTDRKKIVKY